LQRQCRTIHAPRPHAHAVQPARTATRVDNPYAVALLVAKAIGHHQGHLVAACGKAAALLGKNADIMPRMR